MDRETYLKNIEALKARGFEPLNLIEPPEEYVENFIREYPTYDKETITYEMGDAAEELKWQYSTLSGYVHRSKHVDRDIHIAWARAIRILHYDMRSEKLTNKEDIQFQFDVVKALERKLKEEGFIPKDADIAREAKLSRPIFE